MIIAILILALVLLLLIIRRKPRAAKHSPIDDTVIVAEPGHTDPDTFSPGGGDFGGAGSSGGWDKEG